MKIPPDVARAFWRALMDNATSLIADAHLLLAHGSYGRARSFTVLAQEELGKALWLYEVFSTSWSTGTTEPLPVERLKTDGRRHAMKYMEALIFGQALPEFWGDYGAIEYPEDESQEGWNAFFAEKRQKAAAASQRANNEKMAGFYVDLLNGISVQSPSDVTAGTIADDLHTAAQVIEMLLIQDHTRMKHDATTPYDSTHAQQHRLLPISHPDEWDAAPDEFKNGDYYSGQSD